MQKSSGLKEALKWVGVAVIAAIPVFLIVRKLADRQNQPDYDPADVFSDEAQG